MELAETIDSLNRQLVDEFGIDSDTGQAMFRIVWADDQFEKRRIEFNLQGMPFLYARVMEVSKYPYIKGLYVLERLTVVPDVNQDDIPVSKLSYEPIWTFCNADHEYLPPIWGATKFVVDTLLAALGKKSLRKYVDDEKNTTAEGREQRIADLQEELFGNETETCDALRYKEGIVVPSTYKTKES